MSSAASASTSRPLRVARGAGQDQVAEALRPGAQRGRTASSRCRSSRGTSRIRLRPARAVIVGRRTAGRGRRSTTCWVVPGTAGAPPRRSPIRSSGELTTAAVGGVDRAVPAPSLVEGLDPHALRRGSPRPAPRWQSARIRSRLSWALARADDLAGGLGQPHLLGERLALERDDRRPRPACSAYRWSTRALRLVGAPAVGGQVHGEGAAQHAVVVVERGDQQVERVPGVGVVDGVDVGDPAQVSPAVGSRRSCGDEAEQAPVVGLLDLGLEACSTGVRVPWSSSRASVVAGDGHRLELAVARGATLIAATPKPATPVTPSAISWRASTRRGVGPCTDCRAGRRPVSGVSPSSSGLVSPWSALGDLLRAHSRRTEAPLVFTGWRVYCRIVGSGPRL